jgi:hypothetical protein
MLGLTAPEAGSEMNLASPGFTRQALLTNSSQRPTTQTTTVPCKKDKWPIFTRAFGRVFSFRREFHLPWRPLLSDRGTAASKYLSATICNATLKSARSSDRWTRNQPRMNGQCAGVASGLLLSTT